MFAMNRALFWAFVLFVYFIPYETTLTTGTLHSWVLFVGILFVLPQIIANWIRARYRLPFDYVLVLLFAALFGASFLVNIGDAQWYQLQAYLLSLCCYVFARHTAPSIKLAHFFKLNVVFLITNSLLMVAQLATGEYFPARWLADGDPALVITSGFADGPTKNGMIQASALAVVMARLSFQRVRIVSLDTAALLVGMFTILLTTSRAGVVAFVMAALFNFGMLVWWRREVNDSRRLLRVFAIVVLAAALFYQSAKFFTSEDAQTAERAQTGAGRYAAGIVQKKFIPADGDISSLLDGSIEQRFVIYQTALITFQNRPFAAVFGIGLGAFEKAFDENTPNRSLVGAGGSAHNSWIELPFEAGLPALAVFLWLYFHVVRKVLRRPDFLQALPLISAAFSTMIFMLFHDVLRGRMFWLPFGILGAIAYYRGPIEELGTRLARRQLRSR